MGAVGPALAPGALVRVLPRCGCPGTWEVVLVTDERALIRPPAHLASKYAGGPDDDPELLFHVGELHQVQPPPRQRCTPVGTPSTGTWGDEPYYCPGHFQEAIDGC